jgi:predicted outer membrane protein
MRNSFYFYGVAVLAAGLAVISPAVLAQGDAGQTMAQGITGQAFVAHMRRNSDVETSLSKTALKKSSNDAVKKLAAQTIADNRKNEMLLTSAVAGDPDYSSLPYEGVPDVTKQAEKQMKSATGTQLDAIYLAQMKGYFQDDQRTVAAAKSSLKDEKMEQAIDRLQKTADDRVAQVVQVGQAENLKLE